MPATLTQVVKQFPQNWTAQLEPDAILKACHDVGYAWRERCLDPVTTTQLFFVQVVHGNTACTHLRHLTQVKVSASAYCQARTRPLLKSSSGCSGRWVTTATGAARGAKLVGPPHLFCRRLEFLHARYP